MSEAIRWEKTDAGEQGVLITEQRTLKHQGAMRSGIPLSKQIEGTMFETPKPDEPTLFDKKEESK